MFDPSQALSGFRIPADVLIALDNRVFHFAIQPFHFLIRATHVLSVAGFFGAIVVLDLKLMGLSARTALGDLADHLMPWIYGAFAVAVISGALLFFYDPVNVGSHAYFTLKLVFIGLGIGNAALFHNRGYLHARTAGGAMPLRARIAGATSLAFWTLAMVMASLNVEGAPKVLLTR
jgi:hypothetical protein